MDDLENIHKRAEIYKLAIAKASIDEAAETAGLVIANKIDHQHLLYRPLHAAMVITYGRAFSEMKPLWKIAPEWGEFDDPRDQRVHDALMNQRNTMVGHADHVPNKVVIYPTGAVMDNGAVALRVQTETLSNYIPPEDFAYVQRTAGGLVGRLSIAISDQMTDLYGEEGVNLKETIELITEGDIQALEAARKAEKAAKRMQKR